ncbi:MAG: beta-lactamase family protein [Alphaproteobacteria bacterium]|nr:beta-lactamase family protein [Alphaproteobacteria bacterium]
MPLLLPLLPLVLGCTRAPPRSINGDPDADWAPLPGVDDEIVDLMERHGVAGLAACLVEGAAVTWCGGYGEGNPDSGLLATPSTPFMLASVSKAVTTVAVVQAAERGELSLDADIDGILPFEVVHPDSPGAAIHARHLLTHTSGIVDNWDVLEAQYVDGDSDVALGAFLESYLVPGGAGYDSWENFHPDGVGGAYEYSNVGSALSGYLVEAATGTPFDDVCDARIFAPLGMNAGWHLADFDPDLVASPTIYGGGAWEVLPHYGFPDYPNGQLRADARSMGRFLAAVAGGGSLDGQALLTQASVDELMRRQVPDLDEDQALGWYWWALDGDEVIGHNGGDDGVSTEILLRRRDARGVVVLMNAEGHARTLEKVELAILDAAEDR